MVGKTGLSYRLINYHPNNDNEPTLCENIKTILKIDDKDYELEIFESYDTEGYPHLFDLFISFADGILLLFAINNEKSFKFIKDNYDKIIKVKHGNKCPMLLVGNKLDLENEREVSYTEAKLLTEEWGIEYMEISVKNNLNCKEVFEKLAKEIVKIKNFKPKKKTCCTII